MARNDGKRVLVTLRSTEGTGSICTTAKNRLNQRERPELMKYDTEPQRHVLFRESR